MAQSKTESFTSEEIHLARIFKALSHPARISILRILAKRNECVCGEIVGLVPLAQSTVSQHLKELKDVGLVRGELDGPKSCYCINPKTLEKIDKLLSKFIKGINCKC